MITIVECYEPYANEAVHMVYHGDEYDAILRFLATWDGGALADCVHLWDDDKEVYRCNTGHIITTHMIDEGEHSHIWESLKNG